MAIELLAGGTQTGGVNNGNPVTLTPPTLSTGDVVVVFGGHNAVSGQSVQPSGNNSGAYISIYDSGATNPAPHFGVYYQVQGATPDTSISCPGSGASTDGTAYACYCLRGVDASVLDQTRTIAGPTTSSNPDCPSIVTQTNDALVLALALDHLAGTGDISITNPTNYTDQRNARGADNNDATVGGAVRTIASAGTEDPDPFTTWTAGTWRTCTVAIKPLGAVALTAANLDQTSAPVIDSAALAEIVILSAQSFAVAAPVQDAATLVQEHGFVSGELTSGVPTEDVANLTTDYIFVGNDFVVAAPILGQPELSASAPQDHLTPLDFEIAAPTLDASALATTYGLVATADWTIAAPVIDAASFSQSSTLVAADFALSAPVLDPSDIATTYSFAADEFAIAAPIPAAATLSSGIVTIILGSYTLDYGLASLANVDQIIVCSEQPDDYATAIAAKLGAKNFGAGNAFSLPEDGSPAGRKAVSAAITDGVISADGDVVCWAAIDSANSRLMATGTLSGGEPVTTGQNFTLDSFAAHIT